MKKLLAIVPALAVAAAAHAAPHSLKLVNIDPTLTSTATISLDGSSQLVYATPVNLSLDGSAPFMGLCVDVTHHAYVGSTWDVNVLPASALPNGARIAQLYNGFASYVTDADRAAAFQLLTWDILYDNGDGLSTGRFQASGYNSMVGTYVNYGLAADLSPYASTGYFYQSTSGTVQDFFAGTSAAPVPVPEPASMAVLVIGLAALKRRRAKK